MKFEGVNNAIVELAQSITRNKERKCIPLRILSLLKL